MRGKRSALQGLTCPRCVTFAGTFQRRLGKGHLISPGSHPAGKAGKSGEMQSLKTRGGGAEYTASLPCHPRKCRSGYSGVLHPGVLPTPSCTQPVASCTGGKVPVPARVGVCMRVHGCVCTWGCVCLCMRALL